MLSLVSSRFRSSGQLRTSDYREGVVRRSPWSCGYTIQLGLAHESQAADHKQFPFSNASWALLCSQEAGKYIEKCICSLLTKLTQIKCINYLLLI